MTILSADMMDHYHRKATIKYEIEFYYVLMTTLFLSASLHHTII